MESLTRETFWNELKDKYPVQMQHFCDWIDVYKQRVNWEKVFNYGSPHYAKMGWHSPKYHDLPLAMQVGIFVQYVAESPKYVGFDAHRITRSSFDLQEVQSVIHDFFKLSRAKVNNEQIEAATEVYLKTLSHEEVISHGVGRNRTPEAFVNSVFLAGALWALEQPVSILPNLKQEEIRQAAQKFIDAYPGAKIELGRQFNSVQNTFKAGSNWAITHVKTEIIN